MRAAIPALISRPIALAAMGAALLAGASAPACVTSGQVPVADGGPQVLLPDGAPYVPSDGGLSVACIFEQLNTFTCPGLTLAPPVWVPSCVVDDDCRSRVNNTSTTAGCQETTQYQDVKEITTTCAAWEATDAGLPVIDSGPEPPCAPGSVSSFTPVWHPPRPASATACTLAQIDSYRQCLTDFQTILNPPSCDQWSGTLSSANSTCLTCLSSNESDTQYGPLVALPTALIVNVPGCIALAEGKVDGSGCGGSLQADQQCDEAACLPTCSIGTGTLAALESACEAHANVIGGDGGTNGVCATYAVPALCAARIEAGDSGTTAEQQCFGAADGGTNAQFEAVSMAFCGGG